MRFLLRSSGARLATPVLALLFAIACDDGGGSSDGDAPDAAADADADADDDEHRRADDATADDATADDATADDDGSDDDVSDDDSAGDDDGQGDDDAVSDDDMTDDDVSGDDDMTADDDMTDDDIADDDVSGDDDMTADDDTTSDDDATDGGTPAGQRVVHRYLVGPGGAEQYVGPYDTLFQQQCFWDDDPDSDDPRALRCRTAVGGGLQYLDAECTQPILRTGSCPAPGMVARIGANTYRIGESIMPAEVYVDGGSGCTPAAPDSAPRYALELLEDEALPSGTLDVDPALADGLELSFVRSGDARFLYQTLLEGERCLFEALPGPVGDAYCLPQSYDRTGNLYYSDPSCETQNVWPYDPSSYPDGLPERVTSSYNDEDGCYGLLGVFGIGVELTDETTYAASDTGCIESSVDFLGGARLLAPSVDLASFPYFDVLETGASRITHAERVASSGVSVGTVRWFDAEIAGLCFPNRTADGSLRCTPSSSATLSEYYFSDEACQEPLYEAYRDPCIPEGPPPVLIEYQGNGCDTRIAQLVTMNEYAGPLYQFDGLDCLEGTPPPNTSIVTEGDPVEPSELVEFSYELR